MLNTISLFFLAPHCRHSIFTLA